MVNRRSFIKSLALLAPFAARPSLAFGPSSDFTIGQIQYGSGQWDPRPGATVKLLQEIEKRTSILVSNRTPVVAAEGAELFDTPFALVAGDRGFDPFTEEARRNLERYLRAGGTVLFDSAEGVPDGEFAASARRELEAILPDARLERVDSTHVVYKSFYLIDEVPGRVIAAPYLEACAQDGRLVAFVCHNDLQGAWARDNFGNWIYEVHPGGERQREMSYRMGINLAMYVLCQDYKEDQVHVPFILHRRQWRLD